jgi:hypothetical protein
MINRKGGAGMFWRRHRKIAVGLMCADWRLHRKTVAFNSRIARALRVHGVDVIAVPGPDGLLKPEREAEWKTALAQIQLLIGAHNPQALAVVAHQRCAGHPVSDGVHDVDVATTAKTLKEATGFAGPSVALVATYASDSNWGLKRIAAF